MPGLCVVRCCQASGQPCISPYLCCQSGVPRSSACGLFSCDENHSRPVRCCSHQMVRISVAFHFWRHNDCTRWPHRQKIWSGHRRVVSSFSGDISASATLIEKHEKQKKQQSGGHGLVRGRQAAALDAAGAALGSLGLITFAFLGWQLFSEIPTWAALSSATVAWLGVSILAWKLWQSI